jgi:hypothetical protein
MVLLDAHGVGEVAGWYAGITRGEQRLLNVRTHDAFLARHLVKGELAYHRTRTITPSAVQREKWKRTAPEK